MSSKILGRALSIFVVVALLADGLVNIAAPQLIQAEMDAVQFPAELAWIIGAICTVSALLYAIPATAFVGAVMITGFLGGAICTHLRVSEFFSPPQIAALTLGGATWLGLYFRQEDRLRALFLNVKRP